MRVASLLVAAVMFAVPAGAAPIQRHAKQQHPYRQSWKKSTYGRGTVIGHSARAALGHSGTSFAGKLGTGLATNAVKTTVEHGVAARLHEDLHYQRSNKQGFAPRLKHALVSTVVTRNTKNGKRRPAAGRLSGHAAAGAVAGAILPVASGASTAGIGLAADAGANVAREFIPPRHPRHKKKRG